MAKIQANIAGKDAGLMLDELGFVAELNGTNIFMIKNNMVYTPHAHACLPGITRNTIIDMCRANNIEVKEENLSLSQFINAEAVFATGTMGEITPIIDEIVKEGFQNKRRKKSPYEIKCEIIKYQNRHWYS